MSSFWRYIMISVEQDKKPQGPQRSTDPRASTSTAAESSSSGENEPEATVVEQEAPPKPMTAAEFDMRCQQAKFRRQARMEQQARDREESRARRHRAKETAVAAPTDVADAHEAAEVVDQCQEIKTTQEEPEQELRRNQAHNDLQLLEANHQMMPHTYRTTTRNVMLMEGFQVVAFLDEDTYIGTTHHKRSKPIPIPKRPGFEDC